MIYIPAIECFNVALTLHMTHICVVRTRTVCVLIQMSFVILYHNSNRKQMVQQNDVDFMLGVFLIYMKNSIQTLKLLFLLLYSFIETKSVHVRIIKATKFVKLFKTLSSGEKYFFDF